MSESLPSFCSAYIKKSTTTSMLLRRRLTILTSSGLWAVLGVRNIENCPVEGVFLCLLPADGGCNAGEEGHHGGSAAMPARIRVGRGSADEVMIADITDLVRVLGFSRISDTNIGADEPSRRREDKFSPAVESRL